MWLLEHTRELLHYLTLILPPFLSPLSQLPTIIADNAGYDSSQLVSELRALHSEDKTTMGLGMIDDCLIYLLPSLPPSLPLPSLPLPSLSLSLLPHPPSQDMTKGCVGDMMSLGITESFQVKRQVLLSAAEAAEMILRVDNLLRSAPR